MFDSQEEIAALDRFIAEEVTRMAPGYPFKSFDGMPSEHKLYWTFRYQNYQNKIKREIWPEHFPNKQTNMKLSQQQDEAIAKAEAEVRAPVESPALDNTLSEEETVRGPYLEIIKAPPFDPHTDTLPEEVCDDAECRRELEEEFAAQVDGCLDELREMLLTKNKAYGNSALDPVQIFSKANPGEQIAVRIDDKLSRIKSGLPDQEDAKWDIMGYLVLDRIHKKHYSV